MRKLHISVGVSTSGVLLVLALAPAALGAVSSSRHPAASKLHGSPSSRSATYKDVNAGYSAGKSDQNPVTKQTVTTTIVVPKIIQIKSCTTKEQTILAGIYIDFYNEGYPGFADYGMVIGCVKGKARYYPKGKSSLQAHPGDKVVTTVVETATTITWSVVDKTHTSVRLKGSYAGQFNAFTKNFFGALPEPISSSPPLGSVPDFGTMQFSGSTINGQPIGALPNYRFNRYTKGYGGGTLQIKTSPFATNNKSFKLIFEHH